MRLVIFGLLLLILMFGVVYASIMSVNVSLIEPKDGEVYAPGNITVYAKIVDIPDEEPIVVIAKVFTVNISIYVDGKLVHTKYFERSAFCVPPMEVKTNVTITKMGWHNITVRAYLDNRTFLGEDSVKIFIGIPFDWKHVNITHLVYVSSIVCGKLPQDLRFDFNHNNRVDIGDLAKLAYYYLGKICQLKV